MHGTLSLARTSNLNGRVPTACRPIHGLVVADCSMVSIWLRFSRPISYSFNVNGPLQRLDFAVDSNADLALQEPRLANPSLQVLVARVLLPPLPRRQLRRCVLPPRCPP